MKKIVLMLLFTISLNAQSNLIMLFGGAEWKPTDLDANTLVYYDGNEELTTVTWESQGGTANFTFNDSPTMVANATPKRDAVRFNGTTQYGIATIGLTQPYTIYLVMKQVSWTLNDRVFADKDVALRSLLSQAGTTPNMEMFSGLNTNPDLAVGDYGIITCVFNGASSKIRTNLSAEVTGNSGTNSATGITLAAYYNQSQPSNIEVAYIVVRTGADNTATQNIMINNLARLTGVNL